MSFKNSNRRDANEKSLVEYWQAHGCLWIPMRPGAGFDGLLVNSGEIYVVEIKNPEAKWELTPTEARTRDALFAVGVVYHIVESDWDAAVLMGRNGC